MTIQVAPRDAVGANVALTMAGMFTYELAEKGLSGGLLRLDQALGGAMIRLRSDGIFGAAVGELLALAAPAAPILAKTVVLVGLGDPSSWSPATMRIAIAAALREAIRLEAVSAAFAPGLIDSGLGSAGHSGTAEALLAGLMDVLTPVTTKPRKLRRWVFCAGIAHLDTTVRDFRRAFQLAAN